MADKGNFQIGFEGGKVQLPVKAGAGHHGAIQHIDVVAYGDDALGQAAKVVKAHRA